MEREEADDERGIEDIVTDAMLVFEGVSEGPSEVSVALEKLPSMMPMLVLLSVCETPDMPGIASDVDDTVEDDANDADEGDADGDEKGFVNSTYKKNAGMSGDITVILRNWYVPRRS